MFELHHLDLTLPSPAENLACDEALLEWCERGGYSDQGILRFWEPLEHFVVLGYANKAGLEVNLEACRALQVPILRRCSGGGSVLQGPGCLNYTLLLPINREPGLDGISETNRHIMEKHRDAVAALAGLEVAVRGHTDLALGPLKFSGNSQRRKRHWLLFHGTFLLDFDLALMGQVLQPPPKAPAYRQNRSHAEFLTRLQVPAAALKTALQKTWNAVEPLADLPHLLIEQLAREKYRQDSWNFRS